MEEWEYCAVVGLSRYDMRLDPGEPALWRFTPDGIEIIEFSKDPKKEAVEVAQVIAQLGEQGWEMAGCGNTSPYHHAIYFKRRKPQNS